MAWKDAAILRRKWRIRKAMWAIVPFEIFGTVALLVLCALAQPNLYRTELWSIGYQWGFNSNPNVIVYAYSNHQPYPNVPFVWTERITDFSVAISVISLFIWLAKLIGFIMAWWTPMVGLVFSTLMTALYTVSVYGQMGPDYLDPSHPSPVAWYVRKGCAPAKPFGSTSVMHCYMAVGTFAASCIMLALYTTLLALAIHSIVPHRDKGDKDIEHDDDTSQGSPVYDKEYEMQPRKHITTTHAVPFTPRTQAFHTLDRRLPLRDQYQ